MKKSLLLVNTLTIILLSAQNNDELKKDFERQNKENNEKLDSYIAKRYGNIHRTAEIQKKIQEKRENLAGFLPNGNPYFYKKEEARQNSNANSDALSTSGGVNGLAGSFNGEGIKFTIFDGSRVYAAHPAFANGTNRITNKEADSNIYNAHATGVAGLIGSTSVIIDGIPFIADIKGVASNSTMDSYSFATTTLPGNSSTSTVYQKILAAQPKISNHSYGLNSGWDLDTVNGVPSWIWNGEYISPNTTFDLQGTYYKEDENYDKIVYNNPSYIMVKAAGNFFSYGPDYPGSSTFPKYYTDTNGNLVQFAATDTLPATNCSNGVDCIGISSLAKNIIVVGATDVITNNNFRYSAPSDVVHSDYSSAGPRDDGGIKPDIATTGTDVFLASTNEDTIGSVSYDYGSGTSYSAPVVTGVIGLWMQIYKQLFNNAELNAASAKTLMVHSASEAGNVGPDPWFGWGYINAKKGAELLVGKSNNIVTFSDETLANGGNNKKTVIASGSEPLKATISWIDPEYIVPENITFQAAYNDRTSRLVNDLDLRIIDTETGISYMPWKLNALSPMTPATKGDNTVDNVEQVVIDAPVAGRAYRIEVTHKGILKNNDATPATAPQNYSVIATGYTSFLGTKENAVANGIIISPTITKDIVKVLKAPAKSAFNLYDITGKKLQSGIINGDANVDLSTYTKGIYIIEVKAGNDVITKKVIKE